MFILHGDGGQTEVDDLLEVVRLGRTDDPGYVPSHGWMTVGDLRWDMAAADSEPTPPEPGRS